MPKEVEVNAKEIQVVKDETKKLMEESGPVVLRFIMIGGGQVVYKTYKTIAKGVIAEWSWGKWMTEDKNHLWCPPSNQCAVDFRQVAGVYYEEPPKLYPYYKDFYKEELR